MCSCLVKQVDVLGWVHIKGDFIYKGGVKTKESAVTLDCAECAFIYKVCNVHIDLVIILNSGFALLEF